MWDPRLTLKEITFNAAVAVRSAQEKIDLLKAAPHENNHENREALRSAIHQQRLFDDDRKMSETLLERFPEFAGMTLEDIGARFVAAGVNIQNIWGRNIVGPVSQEFALEWLADHSEEFSKLRTAANQSDGATLPKSEGRRVVAQVSDLFPKIESLKKQHTNWSALKCCTEALKRQYPEGKEDYTSEKLRNAYSQRNYRNRT